MKSLINRGVTPFLNLFFIAFFGLFMSQNALAQTEIKTEKKEKAATEVKTDEAVLNIEVAQPVPFLDPDAKVEPVIETTKEEIPVEGTEVDPIEIKAVEPK